MLKRDEDERAVDVEAAKKVAAAHATVLIVHAVGVCTQPKGLLGVVRQHRLDPSAQPDTDKAD